MEKKIKNTIPLELVLFILETKTFLFISQLFLTVLRYHSKCEQCSSSVSVKGCYVQRSLFKEVRGRAEAKLLQL